MAANTNSERQTHRTNRVRPVEKNKTERNHKKKNDNFENILYPAGAFRAMRAIKLFSEHTTITDRIILYFRITLKRTR